MLLGTAQMKTHKLLQTLNFRCPSVVFSRSFGKILQTLLKTHVGNWKRFVTYSFMIHWRKLNFVLSFHRTHLRLRSCILLPNEHLKLAKFMAKPKFALTVTKMASNVTTWNLNWLTSWQNSKTLPSELTFGKYVWGQKKVKWLWSFLSKLFF